MAHFTGIAATIAELKRGAEELEHQAVEETKRAARVIQEELFANTPVWSGETVRNFRFAVGAPPSRGTLPAIGTGEPGPTNHLPLGAEPRRPANEAAARADLEAALSFKRLVDVFGTNTVAATKWNLLDSGVAPAPGRSRTPGGIETPAMQNARHRLPLWR
jgi:hypothetical protein